MTECRPLRPAILVVEDEQLNRELLASEAALESLSCCRMAARIDLISSWNQGDG